MDFGEIMTYVGTAIGAGGLTQVVNWRINRNKAKEEVKSDEIDNIRKSVEVYQTIITDLKARNDEQNERISELTQEVNTLREQLRIERNEHQKQIDSLQKQIIAITRVLGIQSNQKIRADKKKAEK